MKYSTSTCPCQTNCEMLSLMKTKNAIRRLP